MKQTNVAWMQIFQIVKENCTEDFSGPNPEDDVMELTRAYLENKRELDYKMAEWEKLSESIEE